jgi:branched-chain amino acid transport system permease protein
MVEERVRLCRRAPSAGRVGGHFGAPDVVIAYLVAITTLVGIRALLTLGLNVQWGLTGLVNLGIIAFFAVGAYTSALLTVAGTPLALAWSLAIVLASAAGAGLATIALRLREDYLAIVTLGFAEVLRLFLLNEAWLTRGANGVTAIPRPLHARFAAHYDLFYLALVVGAVVLVYLALERVRRSPFGRVLRAIREDEVVATVAGKPVFSFRVQAFALGAGVAGLAGILFAHYLAYVEPNMFLPQESLFVWLALILGGSGNNRGALLGSAALLGLLEGSRFAKDVIPFLTGVRLAAAQQILVGVVLVVLMIRRPEGLLPEKPGSD